MPSRTARVEWNGDFRAGEGMVKPGSGAFEADYSYASIFRDAPGTNPMEILGSSLALCFTGAMAVCLSGAGIASERICTDAQVYTEPQGKGFVVSRIHLHCQVQAPGLEQSALAEHAARAKSICPVGIALGSVEITIEAETV